VFDLDTKHIIDPNDNTKRLLSLAEAVTIGLIVPRSFELSLTKPHYHRINLHEAFFNTQHLHLSLLLYRPEIDNVYIKLTSNLFNKCEYFANATGKKSPLSIVLSKRDKIGLIEAINLKAVDLKAMSYATLGEGVGNVTSLVDAVKKYELVDIELLELLNTPIGGGEHRGHQTLRDCINDMTVVLEKQLVRHPVRGGYVRFDSLDGKEVLSEAVVRQIRRLVTRINVKSYMISLGASQQASLPVSVAGQGEARGAVQRQDVGAGVRAGGQQRPVVNAKVKTKAPPATFYFGQQESEEAGPRARDTLETLWASGHEAAKAAMGKAFYSFVKMWRLNQLQ